MKVKIKDLPSLLGANAEVLNNKQLKEKLPNALFATYAAQKNIKTLQEKFNDQQKVEDGLKTSAASKNDDGTIKTIVDEKTKQKMYDIPEGLLQELTDDINKSREVEVEVTLSIFKEESADVIVRFLNGDQSMIFMEYLIEKTEA
jgi:hypothetical protein